MFRQCIATLRHKLIDALRVRDAAYLKYIYSDRHEFGHQDIKWSLDEANRGVVYLRKEIQIGYK